MRINDKNPNLVEKVNEKIKENIEKYGKPYCPCIPEEFYLTENGKDFICPCKNFRENVKSGEECHCGKYIK